MILNKSLLLKCLGGVAACFGTAGVGILGSQSGLWNNQPSGKETKDSTELGTLIAKVGLTTCTSTDGTNNECTIGSPFNVKQESNSEENKTKNTSNDASTGKIKVYSENTYSNNFKFVIEEGDISFEGSGSITKLEQFETYEIKDEGSGSDKKWYFSRKKKAAEGIKETLGLPSDCTLGDTVDCTDKEISSTNISSLKFDGLNSGQNPSIQGTAKLTVTKETPSDDFPFDYKFEFKGKDGEATLTINGSTITLKQNEATEFRIKKPDTGNSISLEEAWSLNRLLEKVGLTTCNVSGTTECSIGTNGIKVKYTNGSGEEGKKKSSSSTDGKIKVYTESGTPTHNKGFKFVIEEGDISFESGGTITKLEQFETYEIKKDESGSDKKWYLTRKSKAAEEIRKELGLPEGCNLEDSINCNEVEVTTSDISKIKFDGLTSNQSASLSNSAKLTVTKENTTDPDFPYGYKFTFKGKDKDETLTINSKQITLKQSGGTEFRIKKGTSGNSITLEEAWTKERLLEKVGLECNGGTSNDECTQKSGKNINIKQDSENLENKSLESSNQGKIKLYTGDQASGYNHGFKFVIEEKDISITNESDKKLEQFETYEIKKEDNKWYLTRKSKAADGIKTALGLPADNCNLPSSESESSTCCDLDEAKLKAINFDGKGDSEPTINNSGKVNLTITKTTETDKYPLGYKFVFDPTNEITISSTSSIKIAKGSKTEFKIKKGTSGNTITLEKAWNAKSLGEKVGLSCDDSSGDKKCSFTENNINVKNDDSNKIDGAKVKDGGSGDKKITYQEDQEGYNQGIKFTVEGNDCIELTKDGSDGSSTLSIENSSASYEIKEDTADKKWYLTKYTSSQ